MAWEELYFGQGTAISSGGLSATRSFFVDGFTPDATLGQSSANNAIFGDQHPRFTALVVNNASFVPRGAGTFVTVNYVPLIYQDPIPPENTTNEDWTAIDSTFEDVDVEIPIFQEVTKSFGEGAALVEKTVYEAVEHKALFRYSRTVHRITLNATITGGAGVTTQLAISQAVNAETNKLHLIGGVQYLFKADGMRRMSEDEYQFTYRWIHDPGVKNTLIFDQSFSPNLGSIGGYLFPHETDVDGEDSFIIRPYNRMDYGPGVLPEDVPVITFSPAYVTNNTGYQSLPGVS